MSYSTARKMKFSINDFFSKCDQILRIWSHLLKKSLMENFIFCAVFLEEMNSEILKIDIDNANSLEFTNIVLSVLDKDTPRKIHTSKQLKFYIKRHVESNYTEV